MTFQLYYLADLYYTTIEESPNGPLPCRAHLHASSKKSSGEG